MVVWGGAGQVVYAEPGSSGCERLVTNGVVLLLLTALRRPHDVATQRPQQCLGVLLNEPPEQGAIGCTRICLIHAFLTEANDT